jgi:hypothetical protein
MYEASCNGKAKVEVYEACACAVCKSGARWFMCPTIVQRYVISYECTPKFVDTDAVPHDDAVAEIRAKHPGCDLMYLDA